MDNPEAGPSTKTQAFPSIPPQETHDPDLCLAGPATTSVIPRLPPAPTSPASPTLRSSPRRTGKEWETPTVGPPNGVDPQGQSAASSVQDAPAVDVQPVVPVEEGPKYLQPDHFYPLNNGAKPSTSNARRWETLDGHQRRWLSPEDDPLALRGIPVFKPTIDEFRDFEAYVTKTAPWGERSGITKIIPPAEWTSSLPPMDRRTLAHVQIRNPIQQNMFGSAGVFRQNNIEKNKSRPLSVREWFDKCRDDKFAGPSPRVVERDSKEAKEMRAQAEREKKAERQRKKAEKERKRTMRAEAVAAEAEAAARAETELSHSQAAQVNDRDADMTTLSDIVPPLDPSSSTSSHSSPDPVATTPDTEQLDPWYVETDFSSAWLPKNTKSEDYTPEACARLQDKFWKNMGLGEPSWYGADLMQGSLFADKNTPWNVAHLPNLLNRIDTVVPGVNEPYLYFGMWRATFAWHVEDMDLFSINYIHFGAPKFWYAIPQGQAQLFERRLVDWFPSDARHCDQFLRHKACAISPTQLEKHGIRANMLVHNQGEFVITYPRGYHAGFNMGFNCAESVNFALESWIELGRKAKYCQCVSHSVRIDVDKMLAAAADAVALPEGTMLVKRRRLDDGNTPTPVKRRRRANESDPASVITTTDSTVEEKGAIPAVHSIYPDGRIDLGIIEEVEGVPLFPQKRGRPSKFKSAGDGKQADATTSTREKGAPTRTPKVKPVVQQKKISYPCVFCPSLSTEQLLPVMNPTDQVRAASRSKDGRTMAHLRCVQGIPEVWVGEEEWEGKRQEIVLGVEMIVKDRWNLKCICCVDKSLQHTGVKVQCTKGKCPKAFHVSCAIASEQVEYKLWDVEEDVAVTPPPDAPESYQPQFRHVRYLKAEILCPQHNPVMIQLKERQKAEALKNRILALIPGKGVKIKQSNGATFEMVLVRVHEESKYVELDIGNGQTGYYPWDKVDFRESKGPMRENEYARDYIHSRRAVAKTDGGIPAQNLDAQPTTFVTSQAPPARDVRQPVRIIEGALPSTKAVRRSSSSTTPPASQGTSLQPSSHVEHPQAHPQSLRLVPYPEPHDPRGPVCAAHYEGVGRRFHPQHPLSGIHPYPVQPKAYQLPQPHHPLFPPHLQYAAPPYAPPSAMYHTQPSQIIQPVSVSYQLPYLVHPDRLYAQQPLLAVAHPTPYPPFSQAHAQPSLSDSHPRQKMRANAPDPARRASAHASGGSDSTTSNTQSDGRDVGVSLTDLISSPLPNGSIPTQTRGATGGGSDGGVGRIDLGLARMQSLMAAISFKPVPAIHLAGTNGKGSVSAILESVLLASGFRVGRYNSPHLIEPRDAIRVNGDLPTREEYEWCTRRVNEVAKEQMIEATTFEIATAAAYLLLGRAGVQVMIVECGMGGARDATNVLDPALVLASGLTAVGLDHTAFLGETVEAITVEKASIAVSGGVLVIAPQPYPEAAATAAITAVSRDAMPVHAARSTILRESGMVALHPWSPPDPMVVSTPLPTKIPAVQYGDEPKPLVTRLHLPGKHQADNLSLALSILHVVRTNDRALKILPALAQVNDEAIQKGVEVTRWEGRCSWEIYRPVNSAGKDLPVLVDGAHNADSAKTLRAYLDLIGVREVRWIISLSNSKGKSTESVLQPLIRRGDEVMVMEFGTPVEGMPWVQPMPLEEVERAASGMVGEGSVRSVQGRGLEGVQEALEGVLRDAAGEGKRDVVTVLCGSLYLVADFYRLIGVKPP